MSVWTFIRRGFLRSYCSERKIETHFPVKLSFYLYKSFKDEKGKVRGSERWTSVTNCGIRMREKKVSAYKKINSNKQCKQGKNKIKG